MRMERLCRFVIAASLAIALVTAPSSFASSARVDADLTVAERTASFLSTLWNRLGKGVCLLSCDKPALDSAGAKAKKTGVAPSGPIGTPEPSSSLPDSNLRAMAGSDPLG